MSRRGQPGSRRVQLSIALNSTLRCRLVHRGNLLWAPDPGEVHLQVLVPLGQRRSLPACIALASRRSPNGWPRLSPSRRNSRPHRLQLRLHRPPRSRQSRLHRSDATTTSGLRACVRAFPSLVLHNAHLNGVPSRKVHRKSHAGRHPAHKWVPLLRRGHSPLPGLLAPKGLCTVLTKEAAHAPASHRLRAALVPVRPAPRLAVVRTNAPTRSLRPNNLRP